MAYASLCFRTSSLKVGDSAVQLLRDSRASATPTVFVFWHEELLLTSLMSLAPGFRFSLCSTTDGLGGRILAAAWRKLAVPVAVLPRSFSREERLDRLERGLRQVGHLGLAADHGKPRFGVRATPWQLASRVEGTRIVALHIQASASFPLFGLKVPLPFTSLTVEFSGPYPSDVPLETCRLTLREALRELREPLWHRPAYAANRRQNPASAPARAAKVQTPATPSRVSAVVAGATRASYSRKAPPQGAAR